MPRPSDSETTSLPEPIDAAKAARTTDPVINVLRCRTTGRVLAYDVAPADGSLSLLLEALSKAWPLVACSDIAAGGSSTPNADANGDIASKG